jgi:hypothetical protein
MKWKAKMDDQEQEQEQGINIPLLAFGVVSLIAITRALYNLKMGSKDIVNKKEDSAEKVGGKTLEYEVSKE